MTLAHSSDAWISFAGGNPRGLLRLAAGAGRAEASGVGRLEGELGQELPHRRHCAARVFDHQSLGEGIIMRKMVGGLFVAAVLALTCGASNAAPMSLEFGGSTLQRLRSGNAGSDRFTEYGRKNDGVAKTLTVRVISDDLLRSRRRSASWSRRSGPTIPGPGSASCKSRTPRTSSSTISPMAQNPMSASCCGA